MDSQHGPWCVLEDVTIHIYHSKLFSCVSTSKLRFGIIAFLEFYRGNHLYWCYGNGTIWCFRFGYFFVTHQIGLIWGWHWTTHVRYQCIVTYRTNLQHTSKCIVLYLYPLNSEGYNLTLVTFSPSNSIWLHLSYGLARSKREYCITAL